MPGARTNGVRVAVVVPIRSFQDGKTRIRAHRLDIKAELVRFTASSVLAATSAYETFVVTDDSEVKEWAHSMGCAVLRGRGGGLNEDLEFACRDLTTRGYQRVAIVLADLPLLRSEDIAKSLADSGVYIITDAQSVGTNLMSASLPLPLRLCYGESSCAAHSAQAHQAALTLTVVDAGLACYDLDTVDDIEALRELRDIHEQQLRREEIDRLERLFGMAEGLSQPRCPQ